MHTSSGTPAAQRARSGSSGAAAPGTPHAVARSPFLRNSCDQRQAFGSTMPSCYIELAGAKQQKQHAYVAAPPLPAQAHTLHGAETARLRKQVQSLAGDAKAKEALVAQLLQDRSYLASEVLRLQEQLQQAVFNAEAYKAQLGVTHTSWVAANAHISQLHAQLHQARGEQGRSQALASATLAALLAEQQLLLGELASAKASAAASLAALSAELVQLKDELCWSKAVAAAERDAYTAIQELQEQATHAIAVAQAQLTQLDVRSSCQADECDVLIEALHALSGGLGCGAGTRLAADLAAELDAGSSSVASATSLKPVNPDGIAEWRTGGPVVLKVRCAQAAWPQPQQQQQQPLELILKRTPFHSPHAARRLAEEAAASGLQLPPIRTLDRAMRETLHNLVLPLLRPGMRVARMLSFCVRPAACSTGGQAVPGEYDRQLIMVFEHCEGGSLTEFATAMLAGSAQALVSRLTPLLCACSVLVVCCLAVLLGDVGKGGGPGRGGERGGRGWAVLSLMQVWCV